jgi:hypothetical protein
MQTIQDRVPVCGCFAEDRPAFRNRDARLGDEAEPLGNDGDSSLSLRPEVPCLQRWIDLNA